MYVLGFDIGGTKSAVVLANIEDTQVSFLGRYERKTVPDWKKVLNELEENGRKIAKEHGISIGSNGRSGTNWNFLWRPFKFRSQADSFAA